MLKDGKKTKSKKSTKKTTAVKNLPAKKVSAKKVSAKKIAKKAKPSKTHVDISNLPIPTYANVAHYSLGRDPVVSVQVVKAMPINVSARHMASPRDGGDKSVIRRMIQFFRK